mmetsp:Transcript_5069/g.15372  ORF Transcript_5069/g.15372 Transcript_5069/m.15372 type:complete len:454 (-) Transcript_5069:183-1544(-)
MPLACDAKAEQRALLRASLCVEANQLRALQHVRRGALHAAADALAAVQVLRPQMLQHLAQKEAVQKVQPAAGAGRRSSGRRSGSSRVRCSLGNEAGAGKSVLVDSATAASVCGRRRRCRRLVAAAVAVTPLLLPRHSTACLTVSRSTCGAAWGDCARRPRRLPRRDDTRRPLHGWAAGRWRRVRRLVLPMEPAAAAQALAYRTDWQDALVAPCHGCAAATVTTDTNTAASRQRVEAARAGCGQLHRGCADVRGDAEAVVIAADGAAVVLLDRFVDKQEAEQLLQHAGHAVCAAPALVRSSVPARVLEHVKANPAAVAHVEDVGVIVIEIGHQLDGWRVHRVVGRKLEVQMHHHALPAAVRRDHVGAPPQRVVVCRRGRDVAEPRLCQLAQVAREALRRPALWRARARRHNVRSEAALSLAARSEEQRALPARGWSPHQARDREAAETLTSAGL